MNLLAPTRAAIAITLAASILPTRALATSPDDDDDDPARLVLASGAMFSKTTWRGDFGAQSSFEVGLRPTSWLGFYLLGRLGYGNVDERMLTYVSAGATLGFQLTDVVRPYGRIAFSHQHEETLHVVKSDPVGAFFGIGDGIRHRGGGELGLGLEFTVARDGDLGVFLAVEGHGVFFPDSRGPHLYAALSSALGLTYAL